ncbi:MAG TPA: NAD(P)H-dependent oxidoreductase subunit E [Holophagaceae bacterium]|nr:NAD(P)H-dependent oxidoreductase subunit E [Holophagaceae bacterium]
MSKPAEVTVSPIEERVVPILERYGKDPFNLLQILIAVQEAFHFVPQEAMDLISRALFGTRRIRVPAVVSFYSFLSATYQGEYVLHFSDNITDQMLGNRDLVDQLCRKLGVKPGETRKDGRVSVHLTSCTGMCDQGPAALVNYVPVTRLDAARVDRIADLVNAQVPLADWPQEYFHVESQIRRSSNVFRNPPEPGAALRASLERGGAETLKEIYRSDLRGRGGAGFKAAIKWETVRDAVAETRYVLCNADEGEPGTFKDRVLLSEYADMVFEGMTLCGHVVGAREGVLYLRQEYRYLRNSLEAVLARRREKGLLGRGILGSDLDFDIRIHSGAGAYICGMETAMIESIEGKRGTPRKRWPLPVKEGYRNQPTVVNNVETFAAAAAIGLRGGAWFAQLGTMQSTGTKLFCVSGDCERPGIYEYPWGVSCREVLRDCGARDTRFIQVSGPSGTTIREGEFDRLLCFEDLPCVGTLMIFDQRRDPFEVTRNFAAFFQHESCGLCTPCRVGTTLLVEILEKFRSGMGSPVDLEEIRHLAELMKTMSHCGLGQTAQGHCMDALTKFPEVFERRMKSRDFAPAFDLDLALSEARALAGRDDPAAHL